MWDAFAEGSPAHAAKRCVSPCRFIEPQGATDPTELGRKSSHRRGAHGAEFAGEAEATLNCPKERHKKKELEPRSRGLTPSESAGPSTLVALSVCNEQTSAQSTRPALLARALYEKRSAAGCINHRG